jgi:hypothetical protein
MRFILFKEIVNDKLKMMNLQKPDYQLIAN